MAHLLNCLFGTTAQKLSKTFGCWLAGNIWKHEQKQNALDMGQRVRTDSTLGFQSFFADSAD